MARIRAVAKMNAYCERFNRTIREEFIVYHEDKRREVATFNPDWLYWYNWQRPHYTLKLKSPLMKIQDYFRVAKKDPSPIGIIQKLINKAQTV